MKRKSFLSPALTLLLLTALFGFGCTIIYSNQTPIFTQDVAEYPSTWPPRVTNGAQSDCLDISGTFKASNSDSLLPFFIFGTADTHSLDWANLIKINEQILVDPDGATVTIGSPDLDHIEVVVAMHGAPIAKKILTRLRRSLWAAKWFLGIDENSFLCERDSIVVVGAYVFNWDEYRLPNEVKKRHFRRFHPIDVGTSRGYFYFSKATDGSLVMRQSLYVCTGSCGSLDELWRRWEPIISQTTKQH